MGLTLDQLRAKVLKPKSVEADGLKTVQHSLADLLDADDRLRAREAAKCSPAQRLLSMMGRMRSAR